MGLAMCSVRLSRGEVREKERIFDSEEGCYHVVLRGRESSELLLRFAVKAEKMLRNLLEEMRKKDRKKKRKTFSMR